MESSKARELMSAVLKLVLKTGKFIREEQKIFTRDKIEKKHRNDFVSYVDKVSEELLREGLKLLLPAADFLGEESGKTASGSASDLLWIVDPLDGTTNFIHGIPHSCISVALKFKDHVVLGVVYEVNTSECYYALAGEGAFCNEEKITVSPTTDVKDSLIATGFPVNKFTHLDAYLRLLPPIIKGSRGVRRLGAAALDLCYVASGKVEAFYEIGLNPWDVAAGAFIVQEAGGKVSDFKGENHYLWGEEILATNHYIHGEMLKMIDIYYFSAE